MIEGAFNREPTNAEVARIAMLFAGTIDRPEVAAAIGEYVLRNFLMTQRYPAYIVREIHQKEPPAGPDG